MGGRLREDKSTGGVPSDEELDKRFGEMVDEHASGRGKPRALIPIGRMPTVLAWLGNPDLPLVTRDAVIQKAREKHEIAVDDIKRLPRQLRDPLMVFQDGPHSMVVLTAIRNVRNEPVVAAVHLRTRMAHYEVNDVASLRKESAAKIDERILEGELRYWDKKRATDWLSQNDSSIVVGGANPSLDSIRTKADFVNDM